MVSALTATATVAFFFGGVFAQVDQHEKEIGVIRTDQSTTRTELQRLSLVSAETYISRREWQQEKHEIRQELGKVTQRLDAIYNLLVQGTNGRR